MADHDGQIKLPERLISSVDLSRTVRELEAVDESLRQAELRKPGEPTKLARSSTTLEELARLNNIVLTDSAQRTQLLKLMKGFQLHAPRIHVSLAAEPSAKFIQRIAVWMRANISPVILLEIGLQPTLAAGCMVRTNNKMFDMSLRHRFAENRHILVEKIAEIGDEIPPAAPALAPVAAVAAPTVQAPAPAAQAPAARVLPITPPPGAIK